MAYAAAGGIPWHGKGYAAVDAMNSTAALKLSGLDWGVVKAPISATITIDGKRTTKRIEDKFATVRVSDGAILGIVAKDYKLLQNAEAFEILDAVMADVGIEAKYETAGALMGGKQVFMTVKLPDDVVIGKGDRQMQFLFLRTGHDGLTALDILPTSIRVVCFNTSTAAISQRSAWGEDYSGITLWHQGSMEAKIAATKDALKLGLKRLEEFGLTAKQLAELPATAEIVAEFTRLILPPVGILPETRKTECFLKDPSAGWQQGALPRLVWAVPEVKFDKAVIARENKVSIFKSVLEQEDDSMWGLYNAATGYSDHKRPHRWTKGDAAMTSVVYGAGARFKSTAWQAVKELAGV